MLKFLTRRTPPKKPLNHWAAPSNWRNGDEDPMSRKERQAAARRDLRASIEQSRLW